MRVIAGEWRGLRLTPVGAGDKNAHLCPTTDRVRESLFNTLSNLLDFDGLRILDLFAGTGALGFESLSRGAAQCVFVENGRVGQKLISQNTALTKSANRATLLPVNALSLPQNQKAPFDLVFLDPPYGKDMGGPALQNATKNGWIAPDALIIWEEEAPMTQSGFEVIKHKKYGTIHISILSKTP